MLRLSKVSTQWSSALAYAIGLITSDGNLSRDGRHINLTSKDEDLVVLFKACLNLGNAIGKKARGGSSDKKYFVLQFGDVNFYNFLLELGLMPAKSKCLRSLKVPDKYFADFLRGCIDGDGNISAVAHPESQHLQLRVRLFSASIPFLEWVQGVVSRMVGVTGGWIQPCGRSAGMAALSYGKSDSILLLKFIYYSNVEHYLARKYNIAKVYVSR